MRRLVTPVGLMFALTLAVKDVTTVVVTSTLTSLAVAAAALVVLAVPGLAAITADIPRKKEGIR